jgi:hypothetical protein
MLMTVIKKAGCYKHTSMTLSLVKNRNSHAKKEKESSKRGVHSQWTEEDFLYSYAPIIIFVPVPTLAALLSS